MAVGVGIIGCGKITERASLPNLVNYKKAKVKCLCDIKRDAAMKMVKMFGLEVEIYKDWRKMVGRDDLDAILVNTPNYLHCEMAVDSAEEGKHILVEKPIAMSVREADEMIRAADENKVLLMVEQSQRFDPVHQVAKEILDSGILGKINVVRGRLGHAGPEYWSKTSPWFYDKKKSGGGAMIDIGIHILDLIRWLAGKKIIEIFALVDRVEKPFEMEDVGSCLLKFDDGTVGSFEVSWSSRPYEVLTFFYGERGKMTTDVTRTRRPVIVSLCKRGRGQDPNCLRKEIIPKVPKGTAWANAVHYFISCVFEGKKPFASGEEGRDSLKVILAAYESKRKNKWVEIEW